MTEFKCLKAVFILNFFLIMEACSLNNLLRYYTKGDVAAATKVRGRRYD